MVLLMRVIPALGLCRLCKVSQSRTHDALLRHRVRSRSALPRTCKWIPSPRVPRLGRTETTGQTYGQDSHVTSNTPPRSNTGSQ
jgi:hypothetical protein